MKRFRALASQSPAIVISVVALTFSLGGGAGYAASVATGHSATKITWHKLSLKNGWHSGAGAFAGTGTPAFTVSNGVVYLTGVADHSNSSGGLPVLGLLPKGARPRHTLWFAGFNEAASGGVFIKIDPAGHVSVQGPDASFFSSLAGVSFPLGS
jgi:hypothetical protein